MFASRSCQILVEVFCHDAVVNVNVNVTIVVVTIVVVLMQLLVIVMMVMMVLAVPSREKILDRPDCHT